MVRKILKALVREGLLASSRGAQGGYRLAKAPAEVSVADVITALEGPIFLTDCLAEARCTCQLEAQCPCSGAWQHVNRVLVSTLQGVTLADLSKGTFGIRQPSRVAATA
jgi:Rrf2 family protein